MSSVIKVICLGDSGVGKTTLINKFCCVTDDSPQKDKHRVILPYPLKQPDIFAEFWYPKRFPDQSYYLNVHSVLLVYDITNRSSFESAIHKWFQFIISNLPHSVVLLIGTKVDLTQKRAVQIREVESFASMHNLFFMEVSPVDGTNIELVLNVLRIRAGMTSLAAYHHKGKQSIAHIESTNPTTIEANEAELDTNGGLDDAFESELKLDDVASTSEDVPNSDLPEDISHKPVNEAVQSQSLEEPQIIQTNTLPATIALNSGKVDAKFTQTTPYVPDFMFAFKKFEQRKGILIPVFQTEMVDKIPSTEKKRTVSPSRIRFSSTHTPSSSPSPYGTLQREDAPTRLSQNGSKPNKIGRHIVIDVQLGTGRAYPLTVHSGDNAHRLAAAFVAKYGLSEACVRPLAFRIQQVVSEFADTMEELEQEEKRKLEAHVTNKQVATQQPFNLSTGATKRREILTITVDMGPGKKGTITVREGDDPHQLAHNFVKTFQLRKSLVDYIAEQIHQQLLNKQSQALEVSSADKHTISTYSPTEKSTNYDESDESPIPHSPISNYNFHTNISNNTYNIHNSFDHNRSIASDDNSQSLYTGPNFALEKSRPRSATSTPHYPHTPSDPFTRPRTTTPTAGLTHNYPVRPNTTTPTPPSTKSVLFDLEIDLPEGGKGLIRVRDGAVPRKLATEFAMKYHLPTVLVDVLEQMIDIQISNHLKKKNIEKKSKQPDPFSGKVIRYGSAPP